ncbi:MAG: hypothetical protein HHAS10_04370 [Candidatus Altimarinota bacterium]
MYPSIITNTLELNIPYIITLIEICSLDDPEGYVASFDFNNPESFNDFLQIQFLDSLINCGVIEIEDTQNSIIVKARGEFLTKIS